MESGGPSCSQPLARSPLVYASRPRMDRPAYDLEAERQVRARAGPHARTHLDTALATRARPRLICAVLGRLTARQHVVLASSLSAPCFC